MDDRRILWICATPPRVPAGAWLQRGIGRLEWRAAGVPLDGESGDCAAIVLDFPIDGWTPSRLLEQVKRAAPHVPVLVRDPHVTVSDAVRLARQGAWQVLGAGEDPAAAIEEAIQERSAADLARLAEGVGGSGEWERLLVGESREIRQVHHLIRMIGGKRATVLITGESGTGKEIAARCLHLAGPRRRGPMVAVNCGALPENLLEAELFGHVRGAFTGAVQNRAGHFEKARGGTLFLDEIGELPMDLQVKLLRVLQEREFQRLGSSETVRVDVRVVAATNCDLVRRIRQGKFREDLYFRLNVVPIHMPALRQRRGDIPLLAAHLAAKICRQEETPPKSFSDEALAVLAARWWPGNVRELENAIEMAVALSADRTVLAPADFPTAAEPPPATESGEAALPVVPLPDAGMDYERTVAAIERSILEQALRRTGGNKKAAAQMLRLKRTTLSAKVRSLAACR